MPDRFKRRLLAHLSHETYRPSDLKQLADDLGVAAADREAFSQAVEELAEDGQVVWGDNRFVELPPLGAEVIGTFRKNVRGFGFVIPKSKNAHGDLFIPPEGTNDALTGDTVRARVKRSRKPERGGQRAFVGEIVEILERKRSAFTGEVRKSGGQWIVFPDGTSLRDPIVVRDAPSKNAKEGDKVVFEILQYPEGNMLGEGVITKVLGESGRPDVETQAVIDAYGLPGEFPEACFEEARSLTEEFKREIEQILKTGLDAKERMDLRDRFILTIDPPDAKDYDDAISIEKLDQVAGGGEGWRLGVHIADVAHFVTLGSALDEEARDRGNSVYLPRLVIPMLPEILSNGICSLQEAVPRYCKTAFIDYDTNGRVRGTGFAQTLIHSAKRLTYIEAQALIDGDLKKAREHAKTEPNYTDELRHTLLELNTLAKRIEQRRRKAGMIHLELPEVDLVFNDEGRVIDAVPEDDSYTHTLIEMFMVEANEAVARLFEELGVPLLRRTHPEPVPGAMDELSDFARVAGYRVPKSPTREELQGLLEATAGTPAARAVHFAVLRTLTRAEYSPALIGHFALASEAYAHFTSPIRRYPDLTVHRALAAYLERTENGQKRPADDGAKKRLGRALAELDACPDEHELKTIAMRCNGREATAEEAENELRQFLVLQLLQEHIGESMPGIVTGVTNAGVFVQLEKYLADGMIKAEDLPVPGAKPGSRRGIWRIDRRSGALVEANTGRSFNIGDRVEVTIAEIDLPRRQMELVITDSESRSAGKAKRLADKLNMDSEVGGGLGHVERTGADRRAQRSKSRERRKSDFRKEKRDKGKRQ